MLMSPERQEKCPLLVMDVYYNYLTSPGGWKRLNFREVRYRLHVYPGAEEIDIRVHQVGPPVYRH